MKTLTIREAILTKGVPAPGYVYVMRDQEIVLYVGMSRDPLFRLSQHLGIVYKHSPVCPREQFLADIETKKPVFEKALFHASGVGTCILSHTPESLDWSSV